MSMSEFNENAEPAGDNAVKADTAAPGKKTDWRHLLFHRQYIWGLNGVWIGGIVLGFTIFIWLQLGTTAPSSPDVADLAGLKEDSIEQVHDLPTGNSEPDSGLTSSELPAPFAADVQTVKEFAEANREAISRLANNVKNQHSALLQATQHIQGMEASMAALESRLSGFEERIQQLQSPAKASGKSSTAGMHVSSVQRGAAWIEWKGKTWAIKEGDRLGNVTVTRIDAAGRQVFTSDGVIH